MAEKGLGGIMFHGRDGLRSGYLDQEWENGLNWAIDEAEKQGISVWLYDENHYPSGPMGNMIFRKFPNDTMMYLEVVKEAIVPPGKNFSFPILENVNLKFALLFTEEGETQSLDCQNLTGKFKWKNTSDQHYEDEAYEINDFCLSSHLL